MLEKVTFNKKPMKKAVYKEQWDELLAKLVVLQPSNSTTSPTPSL